MIELDDIVEVVADGNNNPGIGSKGLVVDQAGELYTVCWLGKYRERILDREFSIPMYDLYRIYCSDMEEKDLVVIGRKKRIEKGDRVYLISNYGCRIFMYELEQEIFIVEDVLKDGRVLIKYDDPTESSIYGVEEWQVITIDDYNNVVGNSGMSTRAKKLKQKIGLMDLGTSSDLGLEENLFKLNERMEEIVDKVYYFDTIYALKRYILGRPDDYRFIYIKSSDSWVLSRSMDYVHLDLAKFAIQNGMSTEEDYYDAVLYPEKSDIVSFAYTPGVYEDSEQGRIGLQEHDFQMPFCYQYDHGNIGYRGPKDNIGLKDIYVCFGEPLYMIDMSDIYYNGITI